MTYKFKDLEDARHNVDKIAQELIPIVLADFNQYIDEKINPLLPEGYSLKKSTFAKPNGGRFIIDGECFQKDGEDIEAPTSYERDVMDLCRQYVKNKPLIERVDLGFSLKR